jgi:hypothetical protein
LCWRLTKTIIVRCPVCDETRSSYDEIEKHIESGHNAQPTIANLTIKMLQELQKMIPPNTVVLGDDNTFLNQLDYCQTKVDGCTHFL